MPLYLLQIYAPHDGPPADADDLGTRIEAWRAFSKSLEDNGMLVTSQRLYEPDSATTVRVRDGETLITDGPFAETAEFLAGYYLLECPSLDVALEQAARVPNVNFGTVEVRPVMADPEGSPDAKAAAQA